MIVLKDLASMSTSIRFSDYEMAQISDAMPVIIAKAAAAKFVEENWETIMADKEFVALVMDKAATLAAEKLAESIIKQKTSEGIQ